MTQQAAAEATVSDTDQRRQSRRAIWSGALGSALEWFDFSLYGILAATVFPVIFFADLGPTAAVLASFLTFGVGFVARPLGGIICGYLGDRFGRRDVLFATLILMGVCTLGIGVLPTTATWGIAAPIILVALRFLQGFALGGEATGSQLLTMEHSGKKNRAFSAALTLAGSPISQVLANLSLLLLAVGLSEEDYLSWGWRLPFVVALALLVVGVYIRLRVTETPIYVEQVENADTSPRGPLFILKHYWLTILRLALIHSISSLTFYILAVYGLQFLSVNAGFTTAQTLSLLMIANLASIAAVLLGGRFADRFGRRQTYAIGGVFALIAAFTFFPAAATGDYWVVLLPITLGCSAAQFANGANGALFGEAFPTRVRFMGSAMSLTFANLVFGSFVPLIVASVIGLDGDPLPVALCWAGFLIAAIVTALLSKDGTSLEGEEQTFERLGARRAVDA